MIRRMIWTAFLISLAAWGVRLASENRDVLLAKSAWVRQHLAELLGPGAQNEEQADVEEGATGSTETTPPPPSPESGRQGARTDAHTQGSETSALNEAASDVEDSLSDPESAPYAGAYDLRDDGGAARTTLGGADQEAWDDPPPGWDRPSVEAMLEEAGQWLLGPATRRR